MNRFSTILTVTVFGCPLPYAAAQETSENNESQVEETRQAVDPIGSWHSTVDFRGREVKTLLRISSVKEGNLQGTVKVGESELKIEDGRIVGDQVSFTTSAERQGVAYTTDYSGKVDGDKIVGKAVLNLPNRSIDFEWNPTRGVSMEDVLGTWDIQISPQIAPTLVITMKDGKFTGEYTSPNGESQEAQELAIKDKKLSFVAKVNRYGQDITMTFSGRPEGDEIKNGELGLSSSGEKRQVTFTAKRRAK